MKTITVVIPTYNEEENIPLVYERVRRLFSAGLSSYEYEILFIDNHSEDQSRELILELCRRDPKVRAIFNAKNFGFNRSVFYGLLQGSGDCTVLLFADMQDPPEVIEEFVRCWEQGFKIVTGIKNKSRENPFLYGVRAAYYRLIRAISDIDHIAQFDGFGLYDKSFIRVLSQLDDSMPYLRGIVAELGYERKDVFYEQQKRKKGKSSFNFFRLYDVAMLGITSYSKVVLRLATISGFFMAAISFLIGCVTLVMKLMYWDRFEMGIAAISVGLFFLGSVLLFFIGFQGEYILNINTRIMKRPLVIEERRVNFEKTQDGERKEERKETDAGQKGGKG